MRLPPFAASSLLWLTITLLVFEGAELVSRRSGRHPLAHPVLLSTPVLIAILLASGTPYPAYAESTAFLTFMLGPATVALALPLWRHRETVRRLWRPVLLALLAGTLTAILSAVAIGWAFGVPAEILASLAPRAATTPVAMAVATQLGGIASLAAAIVLASGVLGAMIATPLFNRLGITDFRARGFAAGVAAHGFGTARAFQVTEIGGSFAGMGMALNAAATAILLSIAALFL